MGVSIIVGIGKPQPSLKQARLSNSYAKYSLKSPAKERVAKWRAANPHKVRNATMRYLYGITQGDYESMVLQQGGVCAICGNPPNPKSHKGLLCVDHDHVTGHVRGLLCGPCNVALGCLKDSPALLQSAISYLTQGV